MLTGTKTKGVPTDLTEYVDYPRKCRDLTGKFIGALTVMGYVGTDKQFNWWDCLCTQCLRVVRIRDQHLRKGMVRSCGKKGCRAEAKVWKK